MSKWTPEKLRRLIKKYGESQPTFARRLNVSVSTLRDWLYERNPITGPAVPLLDRLAEDIKRCPPQRDEELVGAR